MHAALGDPTRLAVVDALVAGDRSPHELAETLGLPSNLLAHHLRVLQDAGVVARPRSEADRRRTYVRVVPAALTGLIGSVCQLAGPGLRTTGWHLLGAAGTPGLKQLGPDSAKRGRVRRLG